MALMRIIQWCGIAVSCVIVLAQPSLAASGGTINVQAENDLFAGAGDRHYTNGLRLSWFSPPAPEGQNDAGRLTGFLRNQPFFDLGKLRFSFGLGQNMYTPEDIGAADPVRNDRPYAGWLYGSIGVASEKCVEAASTGKDKCLLKNLELDLGMVGPASYARQVQTEWHKLIGAKKPEGWRHQLKNEPGIVLYYEQKYREPILEFSNGAEFDFTPHWGVAAGNVFTYGAGGATLRLGNDLPTDYGPPRIRPSLPGSDFFDPGESMFSCYVFAGAEMRLVARNIFLDGNSFADSRSVDSKPLVLDLQTGLVLTIDRARVAFTQVLRSEEFNGQDKPDMFGSISLSYAY